jgi:hypothetical protein
MHASDNQRLNGRIDFGFYHFLMELPKNFARPEKVVFLQHWLDRRGINKKAPLK